MKININVVGKLTILHKAVAWVVVRGTVFILECVFFFISIVGLFFV